jgi:DNA invertase Pin-like site-specific DNA recombinase
MIGYARVSTREGQPLFDRQVGALRAAGCERVYDDRGSRTEADRPGLRACLDHLHRGDVLVVLDLDRLGRRAGELIRLADELDGRGVGFRALNAAFDTTTLAGRAFLRIQAAFAAMERNLTRQRISEGIAVAKGGRPRVMTPEKLRYAQHLMADRERSIPAVRRALGDLPASSLYHYRHADGSPKAPGRALLSTDRHVPGPNPSGEESPSARSRVSSPADPVSVLT